MRKKNLQFVSNSTHTSCCSRKKEDILYRVPGQKRSTVCLAKNAVPCAWPKILYRVHGLALVEDHKRQTKNKKPRALRSSNFAIQHEAVLSSRRAFCSGSCKHTHCEEKFGFTIG